MANELSQKVGGGSSPAGGGDSGKESGLWEICPECWRRWTHETEKKVISHVELTE